MAPRNPYGIRKVITSTMVMVAAIVMRPTTQVRPGYGASSVLRNCQNQAPALSRAFDGATAVSAWSWADILLHPSGVRWSDDHHRRFAKTERFGLRRLDAHADWKTRGEVHPVERPLHIGQSGRERSDQS